MKTTITLEKKQGLFRPRVTITVELEPWERALVPLNVDMSFTAISNKAIPCHDTENVILFENLEDHRGYTSQAPYLKYELKARKWTWSAFLQWKPGRLTIEDYPELVNLAHRIQDKVAKILTAAMESVEIKQTKELPPPEGYKEKAAACKFAAMAKEDESCGSAND